jgi:hypothetical protein
LHACLKRRVALSVPECRCLFVVGYSMCDRFLKTFNNGLST